MEGGFLGHNRKRQCSREVRLSVISGITVIFVSDMCVLAGGRKLCFLL